MRRRGQSLAAIIRRAVALQTLLLVAVIGLALAGYLLERSVAAGERKDQTVLLRLSSFEFQVLNAETGFRGFALSHREPFLAPYREAFPAIAALRPQLTRLVDDADRPHLNAAFRQIYDWRRNFTAPALAAYRSGRPDAAQAMIDSGQGKARIDRIRRIVNQIRDHEKTDLQRATSQRRTIGIVLGSILVLALLAAVAGGLRVADVLTRAVVTPMRRLSTAAARVRRGELSARADADGATEVASVAESFNSMAAEVEKVVEGLREVDELKTRFLSTVSHELRTPLTSINGYLQLLENGVVGELTREQLGYVHVAQRNGERLASLIDDLLMLSRFDAGHVELASERVDVAVQLRHLLEEMEPVAGKSDSRLELHAPESLIVEGDARRLQQSFANLVSNAVKFNRGGGKVLISAATEDGEAVVEVTDQGVGIPPEELARIGERFFRASTTTSMPGTGLGLAITREIVERHGGRLEIESEPGRGSRFRIRLPRSRNA